MIVIKLTKLVELLYTDDLILKCILLYTLN